MKGALDVVLRHCTTLPDCSPLTLRERDSFVAKSQELGQQGLRGTATIVSSIKHNYVLHFGESTTGISYYIALFF